MLSLSTLCLRYIADTLVHHGDVKGGISLLHVHHRQQLLELLHSWGKLSDALLLRLVTSEMTVLSLPSINGQFNTLSKDALVTCIRRCERLESLDLSHTAITEEIVDAICSEQRTNTLRELRLCDCGLTASQARKIVSTCKRLEILDISCNRDITDEVFNIQGFADVCCDEQECVERSVFSRMIASKSVLSQQEEEVLDRAPTRKRKRTDDLGVSGAKRLKKTACESVDAELDVIPSVLRPHLITLKISGCSQLTNKAVEYISLAFPLLQHIDCSACERITDIGPLLTRCLFLRSLNLSDCRISDTKTHLREPCLRYLDTLQANGHGELDASFTSWLKCCRSTLRILELKNKCIQDLDGFAQELEYLDKLEVINLSGTNITEETMQSLARNSAALMSSLKSVDVGNCTAVNVTSVAKFVSAAPMGLPLLACLSLSGPISGCGVSLGIIGSKCPAVNYLSIGSGRHGAMKQVDIGKTLQAFPRLRELKILCCEFVTYRLVAAIPKLCPQIESVTLAVDIQGKRPDRTCITIHELSQLERNYPNVTFQLWQDSSTGTRYLQSTPGRRAGGVSDVNRLGGKLLFSDPLITLNNAKRQQLIHDRNEC